MIISRKRLERSLNPTYRKVTRTWPLSFKRRRAKERVLERVRARS
jgi:hypothetical protein